MTTLSAGTDCFIINPLRSSALVSTLTMCAPSNSTGLAGVGRKKNYGIKLIYIPRVTAEYFRTPKCSLPSH